MKKVVRPALWTVFILYCFVLAYLLFLSRGARTGYSYAEYIKHFTNFVPFKTIIEYVQRYANGYWWLSTVNLLGNLALFVPMGMALPCVSKKFNRFWKVTLTFLGIVVAVEITQGLLRVGSIDIDDVIFNVSGAMIGYAIVKIPTINKLLQRINLVRTSEKIEVKEK